MEFRKCIFFGVLASSVFLFSSFDSKEAQAQSIPVATYKVQVEYWFFDTDYTYWSTKYETDNWNDANFVYSILLAAKNNGTLNSVVPASYWRYIAIDVRLKTEYNLRFLDYHHSLYPSRILN